jgi:hypothetical protein
MPSRSLRNALEGILGYSELPLVSATYNGCTLSSIVDAQTTFVIDDMVKVLSWYDNETGYPTAWWTWPPWLELSCKQTPQSAASAMRPQGPWRPSRKGVNVWNHAVPLIAGNWKMYKTGRKR